MGRIVIVAYTPKPGKADDLKRLVRKHVPALRSQGLVTDREPVAMEAANGTLIEVFEWASADAIAAAHDNPVVQRLWEEFAAVCDHTPLGRVPEAGELFSEFAPVNLHAR